MPNLILAAAVFVLMHWLVSGTRVRDALTARLGEGRYMGLFSLASTAALVWLIFAFAGARGSAANTQFWGATPATIGLQDAIQIVAIFFVVVGLLTPNPTSVGQQGAVARPVTGMLRITRHPFLCGVAIWAVGHLLVNGRLADLLLFGALLALALVGPSSIDAKRKRGLGDQWDAFAAQTSVVPFAAIAGGRQSLKLGEIGWRLAVALLVYVALIFAHPYIFGVPAVPAR